MTERIVRRGFQRDRVSLKFPFPGRTKQSFRDECDINKIMLKWVATGQLPATNLGTPRYGDFTNSGDYQDACNGVIAANEAFARLPAKTRDRMNNSPARLLEFLADPDNKEEAENLGLIPKARPKATKAVAEPAKPVPTPAPAGPQPAPAPPEGE